MKLCEMQAYYGDGFDAPSNYGGWTCVVFSYPSVLQASTVSSCPFPFLVHSMCMLSKYPFLASHIRFQSSILLDHACRTLPQDTFIRPCIRSCPRGVLAIVVCHLVRRWHLPGWWISFRIGFAGLVLGGGRVGRTTEFPSCAAKQGP